MAKKKFKEIALFVTGMTPQVITETLYALTQEMKPPVLIDEICVITTEAGKTQLVEKLIKSGIWEQFFREYGLDPVLLDDSSIHMVQDGEQEALQDIRNKQDNELLGNLICGMVREKTAADSTRLHGSIAGGRKTMSYYLGAAFQLFARPWDRLYHVLVTPEFESRQDFFYKPKKNRVLTPNSPPLCERGGRGELLPYQKKGLGGVTQLNTKDAHINLAELPFIRLRDKIPLNGRSFTELVAQGQHEIDTAMRQEPLTINISEKSIKIGNEDIDFVPMQLVIYLALVRQKLEHCPHTSHDHCLDCTDCFIPVVDLSTPEALNRMLPDYKAMFDALSGRVETFLKNWSKDGIRPDIIRQNISKINRTIKEHIPDETRSSHYTIAALGKYGSTRYGVRIEKGKIRIVDGRRTYV